MQAVIKGILKNEAAKIISSKAQKYSEITYMSPFLAWNWNIGTLCSNIDSEFVITTQSFFLSVECKMCLSTAVFSSRMNCTTKHIV